MINKFPFATNQSNLITWISQNLILCLFYQSFECITIIYKMIGTSVAKQSNTVVLKLWSAILLCHRRLWWLHWISELLCGGPKRLRTTDLIERHDWDNLYSYPTEIYITDISSMNLVCAFYNFLLLSSLAIKWIKNPHKFPFRLKTIFFFVVVNLICIKIINSFSSLSAKWP